MAARLSAIFYILLCIEVGLVLTLLPWIHDFGFFRLGDWSENYFLLIASQKAGLHGLQQVISSGWVRGAVTGVGLLNLGVAVWEIIHFEQTVRALEGGSARTPTPPVAPKDGAQPSIPDHLPHHERNDATGEQPGQ